MRALTAATPGNSKDSYSCRSRTNRLSSVAGAAGTRSFIYDGRGNLAGESLPGGANITTDYDGHAQLTGYVRSDVGSFTFAYKGRADRVVQTNGAGRGRFIYDPDGRVLGEYGHSAMDVKAELIRALPAVANENGSGTTKTWVAIWRSRSRRPADLALRN
ncbi:MAG: hypothetical protein J0G94_07805 [Sphingomonadales bacterium]|nr:hypothetical protein [Sphingomonadales bacterium]